MATKNNKLYMRAIQALGAKKYLKTVENGVKASRKSIDDFYTMLENEKGIVCWVSSNGEHYYEANKKESKRYKDEADMLFDLALLVS